MNPFTSHHALRLIALMLRPDVVPANQTRRLERRFISLQPGGGSRTITKEAFCSQPEVRTDERERDEEDSWHLLYICTCGPAMYETHTSQCVPAHQSCTTQCLALVPFSMGNTQASTNTFIGAYVDRLLEEQRSGSSKGASRGKVGLAFEDFVHIFWVFSASASRDEKEEGGVSRLVAMLVISL